MMMNMAPDNILEYLELGDKFKDTKMKEKAMKYLKDNITYSIDSAFWEDFAKNNPSLMLEVLRNIVQTPEMSEPICGTISVSAVKEIYETRQGQKGLAEDMEKLKNEDEFTDIELVCEEVTLKHHKVILASRSPVFKAMFLNNFKEGMSGVVMIEDVKLDILKVNIFKTCHNFIYFQLKLNKL